MGARDYILLLSPLVVAIGILISSLLIKKQMQMTYNLHRREKALSYSLYSNAHLRDARLKIEKEFGPLFGIREAISMKEIKEKVGKDSEIQAAIMTILAHWENMALAIITGIADNEVCRDMVASTLIQHLRVFYNFVEERREKNPRVYINLVKLSRRWQDELGQTPHVDYNPVLRS
ncbi:DUF4760 domain-containing protein [Nitrogeniibacter aestuarii]|uniref:DUF4760 domain-containing protein n=1 Tax=Nitrogeniibacter aestuarii TaxID=2815343 RepID=UPI001D11AB5B|nr:DUF4760 domain-containing protein [Nitrogeniibacter aestuarii]